MEPKIVRHCGTIEHWSTSRHALGIYTGIANSCRYVITKQRLQGRPVQVVVEEALARLILRLGGLRVGIIKEDTNQASFVSVPSMNLRDFIEWDTVKAPSQAQLDARVLGATKRRLEQLWPDTANRPPWKLLVVQNDASSLGEVTLEISFATHHALADGKSTVVFHNGLLRELNSPSPAPAGLKNHVLSFDVPPALAPAQKELVQIKIGWLFFLKCLWDEFGPSWIKPKPRVQPWVGKVITLEPHRLNLRLISISPKTVTRLVTTCRAHGATLTGIIHVLVLAAVTRRVPAEVAPALSSETPISLLPWAKVPPGTEMDLESVLTVLTTTSNRVWDAETVADLRRRLGEVDEGLEEGLLWPLAATWRAEMKAKLASMPDDDICGLMDYVKDWQKRWAGKIGKRRDSTWELSNIGSIKGVTNEGQGAWSIQRSFFAQPAALAGPAFAVNVAGVEGAEVTLTLSYQAGIIDETVVDGVAEDLSAWLEKFQVNGTFGITNRS